jgi:hypothetical protein
MYSFSPRKQPRSRDGNAQQTKGISTRGLFSASPAASQAPSPSSGASLWQTRRALMCGATTRSPLRGHVRQQTAIRGTPRAAQISATGAALGDEPGSPFVSKEARRVHAPAGGDRAGPQWRHCGEKSGQRERERDRADCKLELLRENLTAEPLLPRGYARARPPTGRAAPRGRRGRRPVESGARGLRCQAHERAASIAR